jgi:hypothetical protein
MGPTAATDKRWIGLTLGSRTLVDTDDRRAGVVLDASGRRLDGRAFIARALEEWDALGQPWTEMMLAILLLAPASIALLRQSYRSSCTRRDRRWFAPIATLHLSMGVALLAHFV